MFGLDFIFISFYRFVQSTVYSDGPFTLHRSFGRHTSMCPECPQLLCLQWSSAARESTKSRSPLQYLCRCVWGHRPPTDRSSECMWFSERSGGNHLVSSCRIFVWYVYITIHNYVWGHPRASFHRDTHWTLPFYIWQGRVHLWYKFMK